MSIVLDGTTGLAGAATGALNGSLGATTPSTVAATTISASGVITATGGVVVGASAAPAFRAYQGTLQSVSDNTTTKLTLNTEVFDTNSNYDTSTYRFTPTVAGYYFISGTLYFNAPNAYAQVRIYKNGSQDAGGFQMGNGAYVYGSTATALIYLNGSTDYVELYGYQNSGTAKNTEAGSAITYFSGFLARSA